MQITGFNNTSIKWIILCVTIVSYTVAFNGSSVGPIIHRCRLRQGDSCLLTFLVFCVDDLSQTLSKATNDGYINECKITMNAPQVTHLLFADDGFLFFKDTGDQVRSIKSLLNEYGCKFGQVVNYQKSGIFFSTNVRRNKQQEIKYILGVHSDLGDSKYTGFPSLVGRLKKRIFWVC